MTWKEWWMGIPEGTGGRVKMQFGDWFFLGVFVVLPWGGAVVMGAATLVKWYG